MKLKEIIKQALKEASYNYSFSTDVKDVDKQKLQAKFVSMIQDINESLKKTNKIKKFKFRQRKDSTDMFVWINDSEEAKVIKKEELDPIEKDFISKLVKESGLKEDEVKKFIRTNEEDQFEYLIVAKYLLKK